MIIGHQTIRERLLRSVQHKTIAQAYLFTGPESVGKFDVAMEFALSITEHCQEDIVILEPIKETRKGIVKEKSISSEQSREATRWLAQFPYRASKKVVLIRDAHRLTETAQNALLKTLEEPKSFAVIILVTHEMERILPTVVSRCHRIAFQLVPYQDMMQLKSSHSQEIQQVLHDDVFWRLGRPGVVFRILKQDTASLLEYKMFQDLCTITTQSLRERFSFSETYASDPARLMEVLSWYSCVVHANILASTSADAIAVHTLRMQKIEKLRKDMKQFVASTRLLVDEMVLNWDVVTESR